nr:hypothetical protein [Haloferax sp. ATB1]
MLVKEVVVTRNNVVCPCCERTLKKDVIVRVVFNYLDRDFWVDNFGPGESDKIVWKCLLLFFIEGQAVISEDLRNSSRASSEMTI